MERNLPSDEHKKAWSEFERILMYRANVAFLSKVLFFLIWSGFGNANFQQSEEYIDEDGSHNQNLISDTFVYLKWAMIVMTFGRLILIFISLKNLNVCKLYIYYQVVYLLLESLLPRDYGDM